MFVIKYRWVFFIISAILVIASVFALFRFGLNLGTDFTGGSILEVEYAGVRPEVSQVQSALAPYNLGNISVQPAGEKGMILRFREVGEDVHQNILSALSQTGTSTETRFSAVGPVLGQELARKGLIAIVLVVILIIAYIAIAFSGVSRAVSSWKYGVIAIVALVHDIMIPLGVFSWLGFYRGIEVDALFLTALLTILGLSVNDTIVIFDRIRENLRRRASNQTFAEVVGNSLRQTFVRSINTSLSIVIALLALFFFGGESTRYFALALTIGMVVGTYSSIFLASPLLVAWAGADAKK